MCKPAQEACFICRAPNLFKYCASRVQEACFICRAPPIFFKYCASRVQSGFILPRCRQYSLNIVQAECKKLVSFARRQSSFKYCASRVQEACFILPAPPIFFKYCASRGCKKLVSFAEAPPIFFKYCASRVQKTCFILPSAANIL